MAFVVGAFLTGECVRQCRGGCGAAAATPSHATAPATVQPRCLWPLQGRPWLQAATKSGPAGNAPHTPCEPPAWWLPGPGPGPACWFQPVARAARCWPVAPVQACGLCATTFGSWTSACRGCISTPSARWCWRRSCRRSACPGCWSRRCARGGCVGEGSCVCVWVGMCGRRLGGRVVHVAGLLRACVHARAPAAHLPRRITTRTVSRMHAHGPHGYHFPPRKVPRLLERLHAALLPPPPKSGLHTSMPCLPRPPQASPAVVGAMLLLQASLLCVVEEHMYAAGHTDSAPEVMYPGAAALRCAPGEPLLLPQRSRTGAGPRMHPGRMLMPCLAKGCRLRQGMRGSWLVGWCALQGAEQPWVGGWVASAACTPLESRVCTHVGWVGAGLPAAAWTHGSGTARWRLCTLRMHARHGLPPP